MDNIEKSDTKEEKDSINSVQNHKDFEIALKTKLESVIAVEMKITEFAEKIGNTENPQERERIRTEFRKLLEIQNYKDESLSFTEFTEKYREYKSDVISRCRDYKSDLIADRNLLYTYGLYRKYIEDSFDEFITEFRKVGDMRARKTEHLISFSEFERCLYYHALSLLYHQGNESPTIDEVNEMIYSKPYGDSSLYPQNKIWQIVGFPGNRHMKAYRDYYCDLAIMQKAFFAGEMTNTDAGTTEK